MSNTGLSMSGSTSQKMPKRPKAKEKGITAPIIIGIIGLLVGATGTYFSVAAVQALWPFEKSSLSQSSSPPTGLFKTIEQPNPLQSGSTNYNYDTQKYVFMSGGPRLGTIGGWVDDSGHIGRSYFLWFDWQLPAGTRLESAYLDLSSLQDMYGNQPAFSRTGPLFVTPVEHPHDLFPSGKSQDMDATFLPGIRILDQSLEVDKPSDLGHVDVSNIIRALQRTARSSVSFEIRFYPTRETDFRYFLVDPKLFIEYTYIR